MNTLDTLLDHTGRVDDLDAAGLARSRAAVHRAAVDLAPTVPSDLARRRRRLVLAGTAAVVAAAVVTVPVVSFGGSGTNADADAAGVLRRAGAAAGDQPGGWPDAAYWHSTSTYVRDGRTFRREIWVAHHGGPSVLRDPGVPGPDGRLGGAARLIPGAGVFSAGSTSLTWDQLYALPTDPARLRAELAADLHGAGPDPTTELFVAVGDLLRESPAAPALRRALYDVAAGIPGVRVTGTVTDAARRTGTGVTYGGETYVIDPGTGRLLAEVEPGWRATYLDQGPAAAAPALPAK